MGKIMTQPALYLEKKNNIAWITLNRPARKNALNLAMWQALPPLVAEAEADDEIRLLVLRSSTDGIFCAGADISEFDLFIKDEEKRTQNRVAMRDACNALEKFSRPSVALIDGDCVGGGCMLALSCDLRMSSPSSRFGITPAKLGLVYGLSDTRRLMDLVGPDMAKSLLFSARLITAEDAVRIGLISEIFPADRLQEEVMEFARLVEANSPHSLMEMKKIIGRIQDGVRYDDDQSEAIFDAAFTGDDHREGVEAFLAKRKAQFGKSNKP